MSIIAPVEQEQNRVRAFTFTVNNYTTTTINDISKMKGYSYLIMGKEIAPTTGTPHLQSFIYFKDQKTLSSVIKMFNKIESSNKPHIEEMKTTTKACIEYSKKDGDYTEYGTPPKDKAELINKVINCVWQDIDIDIKAGLTYKQLTSKYPEQSMKYAGGLYTHYNLHKPQEQEQLTELRAWQQQLITTIEEHQRNDRVIHWIYDEVGNNGKTVLSHHLITTQKYIKLKNGKTADIAMLWNGENVVFDLSRTQSDTINYDVIEQIKDGYVVSPKYQSTIKHHKKPIIIIMANFPPKIDSMSHDRWQIYTIRKNNLINITDDLITPPQQEDISETHSNYSDPLDHNIGNIKITPTKYNKDRKREDKATKAWSKRQTSK